MVYSKQVTNQYNISFRQEFKLMSDVYDCLVSQKAQQDFLLQRKITMRYQKDKATVHGKRNQKEKKRIFTLKRCDPV